MVRKTLHTLFIDIIIDWKDFVFRRHSNRPACEMTSFDAVLEQMARAAQLYLRARRGDTFPLTVGDHSMPPPSDCVVR